MIGDGANDCMDCELSLLQSSSDTLSATGHPPPGHLPPPLRVAV